jgi:septal ring factor EnvC (AmiA/AmiB activator)
MKNLHWYIIVTLIIGSFTLYYIHDIEEKNKILESIKSDMLQTTDENQGIVEEVLMNMDKIDEEQSKLKDSLNNFKIVTEEKNQKIEKTKTELNQIKNKRIDVILDTVFVKDSVFYSKQEFYELFDK